MSACRGLEQPEAARCETILVVEDDRGIRLNLQELLEEEGYRVTTAENGREALSRLRSEVVPDLILLDLRMPVMDGWEFRTEQKNDPALASIPVLAVSADGSAQAAAIDAHAYLRKPLSAEVLLGTIERILGEGEREPLLREVVEADLLRECRLGLDRIRDAVKDLRHLSRPSDVGQVLLKVMMNAVQAIPAGQADKNQVTLTTHVENDQVIADIRLVLSASVPRAQEPLSVDAFDSGRTPQRARMLVIDHFLTLGETLFRALAEHDVTVVTRAEDAFSRLAAGQTFDVVLCDLLMPDVGGRAFYNRLKAEWPELAGRVIFMTDGAFMPESQVFLEHWPHRVLDRPFALDDLREVIDDLMADLDDERN